MSIRLAATIMIVRQGPSGAEILFLQRSRKVGFFPSAWVFPGGRVDENDHRFPTIGRVPGLNDSAFAVAAIREAYEEAGIWLGQGSPSSDLRESLNSRTTELPLDGTLKGDLSRILQWSWWITPDTEPKRYDTRFFICEVPYEPEQVIEPDASETVEARWLTARAALQLHREDQFFMAPPTFITLLEIESCETVQELWKMAQSREVVPIQPIHDKSVQPMEICFPAHPKHPESHLILPYHSVVLDSLQWVGKC